LKLRFATNEQYHQSEFRNFILRPQVIIIKKGNNSNSQKIGETVSLMEHLDIVIKNIEFLA